MNAPIDEVREATFKTLRASLDRVGAGLVALQHACGCPPPGCERCTGEAVLFRMALSLIDSWYESEVRLHKILGGKEAIRRSVEQTANQIEGAGRAMRKMAAAVRAEAQPMTPDEVGATIDRIAESAMGAGRAIRRFLAEGFHPDPEARPR